jgi:hypothetical protein
MAAAITEPPVKRTDLPKTSPIHPLVQSTRTYPTIQNFMLTFLLIIPDLFTLKDFGPPLTVGEVQIE